MNSEQYWYMLEKYYAVTVGEGRRVGIGNAVQEACACPLEREVDSYPQYI